MRADDEAADETRVAKANLSLRRMDVDVDQPRGRLDEEGGDRMAVTRQEVGIGGAERAVELLVAHRPVVDEEELPEAIAAIVGRQAGEAGEADAFALCVDGDRVVAELRVRAPAPYGEADRRWRRNR